MKDATSSDESSKGVFEPTRWTLVARAGGGEDSVARSALGELCEIYYEPVLAFIRHQTPAGERSRDLAHAFFETLLASHGIGQPDPRRGRFRSYLIGAVKNFLAKQHHAAQTQKRGGGIDHLPITDVPDDTSTLPPDQFDRDWSLAVITRSVEELRTEMDAAGKAELFTALAPSLDGNATFAAADTATALGTTENSIRIAVHRLRKRFRQIVRTIVADTLQDPADLEDEIRHLITILSAESGQSDNWEDGQS